mmetsp:Transcript_36789/g.65876  ORF Transcript_36789/g.65876 Transcript_36789/m.65876 type:complete len:239 (+) Transcript_36789:402-1118(+)
MTDITFRGPSSFSLLKMRCTCLASVRPPASQSMISCSRMTHSSSDTNWFHLQEANRKESPSSAASLHIASSTSAFLGDTFANSASRSSGIRNSPRLPSSNNSRRGVKRALSRSSKQGLFGLSSFTWRSETWNSTASSSPTSRERMASPPCSPAQGRVCQDWYGISRVRDWMIASGASLVVWKLSLHPSLSCSMLAMPSSFQPFRLASHHPTRGASSTKQSVGCRRTVTPIGGGSSVGT